MASPVAYLVRRGHLPTRPSYLLISLPLWGCRSRAPAAPSSQPQGKQAVSKAAAGAARTAGVAIRIPAKGGVPRVYRLPGMAEIPTAIRGRLPQVRRVIGLDAEAEFLYVTTPQKDTTRKKSAKAKSEKSDTTPKSDVLGRSPDGSAGPAGGHVHRPERPPARAGVLAVGSPHLRGPAHGAWPGRDRSLRSGRDRRRRAAPSGRNDPARPPGTLAVGQADGGRLGVGGGSAREAPGGVGALHVARRSARDRAGRVAARAARRRHRLLPARFPDRDGAREGRGVGLLDAHGVAAPR